MKKLIVTALLAASIGLSGCKADIYESGTAKASLEKNGYTVSVWAGSDVKNHIQGLNLEEHNIIDTCYGDKKENDEIKDVFVAFYFKTVDEAEKFLSANENANLGMLYDFAKKYVDADYKVGSKNNVAFAGSVTSVAYAGLA